MIYDNIKNFTRGWIIGDFKPSLLQTSAFEVAVLYHKKAESIAKHKHEHAIEYNVVLSGCLEVNNEIVRENDIFIFDKNEVANVKVLEDTKVLCIKTPSVPKDKVYV